MAKKTTIIREIENVLRTYELMIIISADLREPEAKKVLKEVTDLIEKSGGKITNEDFWGKRDFAYRIGKHSEGYYIVYNAQYQKTIHIKNMI